ncbi:hypothetical protein ACA910_012503 [Epithemia clementina (nom. ined.)]
MNLCVRCRQSFIVAGLIQASLREHTPTRIKLTLGLLQLARLLFPLLHENPLLYIKLGICTRRMSHQ